MFHSIFWRLQFSYGLLLLVAISALSISAYHLVKVNQFTGVKIAIQSRAIHINRALAHVSRHPAPRLRDRPAEGTPVLLTPVQTNRFENAEGGPPYYYRIWGSGDNPPLLFESKHAPENTLRFPLEHDLTEEVFIQGDRLERLNLLDSNYLILVGRGIPDELKELKSLLWKMTFSCLGLFVTGLIVSFWLSKRALAPIDDISAAAKQIAGGAFEQRINVSNHQSELGELGNILNHTFDELENAYRRQEQFTADASHELRTPLTMILTEVQSLPKGARTTEEYEEALTVCENATLSMRQLLEKLLNLARLRAEPDAKLNKPIDLKGVIQTSIEQIQPIADQKDVAISLEGPESFCKGDATRLGQVFSNLLDNAVYYNQVGGSVEVTIQNTEDKSIIKVTDTGIGIPEDDLQQIFERFYRVDKSRTDNRHSGLGLAICREIVTQHNGTIDAQSTLGEGTTITLVIPAITSGKSE